MLLAVCLFISTGIAAADNALTVHAVEASAQIKPRTPNQRQLNLPSLELAVVAEIDCPTDTEAESVTISVADTHQRYGPEAILETTTLEALVSVPGSQLAPITSVEFCIAGAPTDEKSLLVPGVASAQVSLRCRSESSSSVYFAAVALPLKLECVSDENQESSTDR